MEVDPVKRLPKQLLGFDFVKRVEKWQQDLTDMKDIPFEQVKADIVSLSSSMERGWF